MTTLKSAEELARQSDAAVLILGRTGTGKTTLAEKIHQEGTRASGPFVNVNLASLHEATIESTLFGHERGAFTGADRSRIGRLELADGGTVFFDEIGELTLPLQARLLEFLQTKRLTPLGSNRERRLNVRVICATNRDLERDVREGRFREDLFHRIRVLTIELAPLSSATGEAFSRAIHRSIEVMSAKLGLTVRKLSKEVAELFECYSWPGNFRELESVLEVAILSSEGRGDLELRHLPSWFVEKAKTGVEYRVAPREMMKPFQGIGDSIAPAQVRVGQSYTSMMEKFESEVIRIYIERNRGCLAKAARDAGLPKATFYRKAQSYRLVHV